MKKKIVFAGGGIGAKAIRTYQMIEFMRNIHEGENFESTDLILSYKDQGNADRIAFEEERDLEKTLRECDSQKRMIRSCGERKTFNITELIRGKNNNDKSPVTAERVCKDAGMNLNDLDLFLTSFEQTVDTDSGFFQRPPLSSYMTGIASGTDTYMKQINVWIDAMLNGTSLYLAIPTGLLGAESIGATNSLLCAFHDAFRAKCQKEGKSPDQAKEILDKQRHFLLVAIGGYKPPVDGGSVLRTDFKKRSAEALTSMAETCKDLVDGIIYVAPDEPINVSGVKNKLGGDQDYHCSLIFLEVAKAIHEWMEGGINSAGMRNSNGSLKILVDPIAPYGRRRKLSYEDLCLPKGWKNMFGSYISFASAFLLAVDQMVKGTDDEIKTQGLFRNIFGEKVNKMTDTDIENKIRIPVNKFSQLLSRHLKMLFEIGATGSDWTRKDGLMYDYVTLYNASEIKSIIDAWDEYTLNGNMTIDSRYDLRGLTEFGKTDEQKQNMRTRELRLDGLINSMISNARGGHGLFGRKQSDNKNLCDAFNILYGLVKI